MQVRVALIGDLDERVIAHRAIPVALELAGKALGSVELTYEWKHTAAIGSLEGYQGVWCVPASPYADEAAAIGAIRWAREKRVPFLGTCGGFQHAVLEFARNVLGICGAEHEETAKDGGVMVVSRLACSLVEVEQEVMPVAGSRFAEIFGEGPIRVGYHCNFGFDANFEGRFAEAGMRVGARDGQGEVRAVELVGHPFFVGTLFQPERSALEGRLSRLVEAFVGAVAGRG